jgi:heme O synthase-like polyprenyltransferase
MASFGMLRRVALVRTDVSEELSASIISVRRICELGTTLAVTSARLLLVASNVVPSSPILVTLMMEALRYSKTSVLTRSTRRNITEVGILHSHRRENLKSYTGP